ncbi:serine/threonine protein kinase [Actinomadura pelletieri DSM 43383]|uniref:Serine/threonine protein kinase n=1 Tax=Actinomadura pelletieri DSM 43383 TaxID=1120940 RepID=A0A495R0A4_9ACTN|nr:serine/threonine-protein kinase [Actinomadura pelletieri]RKS79767.1 serine/threonine protein kinase [Actinomadura pelletieri DSM 43383]
MPEALPLQPGDPRRLGAFEITGRLGVGEQGTVFLGRDPSGGPVAVKVLHVRLSGEPAARSRFADAFASARKVSGFCTAAILHADVEGDRPYVVSQWVDGPSLQQLVDEEGPRGGTVVERVAVGTAIALAAVHRASALHHSLKPGNVLLGRDGPRLCDFGIAQALEAVNASFSGHMTEDPSYKAPEQLRGSGSGEAVDVFAWASTLLFAATGALPFGDGSPSEVMQRIVYDDADLAKVPDSLRDVMAAALAKDPDDRPTARQLLERLLDENAPLAGRTPPTMVEEGRALASGRPAPQPAPAPAPPIPPTQLPRTPMGAPPHPAPTTGQGPAPSTPPAFTPGPPTPPNPPAPAPGMPPAQGDPSTPSIPLLGKLSRMRRPRPEPRPEPGPSPADLDPAAFEETTAFQALDENDPPRSAPSGRIDETTRLDPISVDRTATFDAVDLDETGDSAESAPHLIPGLASGHDGNEHGRSPFASRAKSRRPSNHVLGVALSLFIGVGVGIAIIALVLWPQLRADDNDPPPDNANASNNRPVTTIPSAFGGTWKGTMVNTNRNVSFPLEVTFTSGGTTGRVFYPRERCNGTVTLTRGTESALKMSLSVGKPCTSGVVEITRQPDGTIQYTWSRPGTNLGYGGRLNRG